MKTTISKELKSLLELEGVAKETIQLVEAQYTNGINSVIEHYEGGKLKDKTSSLAEMAANNRLIK